MKKFLSLLAVVLIAMAAKAGVTDRFDGTTLPLTNSYVQQSYTGESTAEYLVTLKDDGSGPQFKAGSSSIVVTKPFSRITKITVLWGSKSNEDVAVYSQDAPYTTSSASPTGEQIASIPFAANNASSITFDENTNLQYIALTSTANKGKAAQFQSIEIEWEGGSAVVDALDGIRINEVCGDDGTDGGNEDWIELYNTTGKDINIGGAYIIKTDEDGVSETLCTIAEGEVITAAGYYVIEKGTHFVSGISNNKNLTISLFSALDNRIDLFNKDREFTHNGYHRPGQSYSYFGNTGDTWLVATATKGEANVEAPEQEVKLAKYAPVTSADALTDGMQLAFVNLQYGNAMSADWDKTGDNGVYLYGYEVFDADAIDADGNLTMPEGLAFVTLCDGGDGTWALLFGETYNYLNDSRYMACTAFKNIDFKKKDDPTKGTRATITFNDGGDAEISFGEAAGSIKFNYKNNGLSRFFNYDPADKPEDHLAVHLFTPASDAPSGIEIDTADTLAAPVYYNLQGVRVLTPTPGLYICKQGSKTTKVLIK